LSMELLGNVGRRDGPEQLALFTHARRERERDVLELRRDSLSAAATKVLGRLKPGLLLSDPLQVPGRRRVGNAARQEVVAGEPGGYFHHDSRLAELLDRLAQN